MAIKNIKMIGRDTKQQLQAHMSNASSHYEYKDAFTGQPIDPNLLYDKSQLLPHNPRMEAGGFEYDSLVVEIENSPNLQAEIQTVLEAYRNPDFVWHKDPGGGRAIQTMNVKGNRPVYYDVHHEDNGTVHLHLKVFRYAIDQNTNRAVLAPNEINRVQEAQQEYLKSLLVSKNLPSNTVSIGNAIRSTNQTASPLTKTQVAGIQEEIKRNPNALDEVLARVIETTKIDETTINTALNDKEKELAALLEKAKEKQNEILKLKEAQNVVIENQQLHNKVKALEIKIEKLDDEVKGKSIEIEELNTKHQEEITEKQKTIMIYSETIANLEEDKKGLTNDLFNVEDLLKIEKETTGKLTTDIEEIKGVNKTQKELLESQRKEISAIKETIAKQQEEIKDNQQKLILIETENQELKEANASLVKVNEQLSNTIKSFTHFVDRLKTSYDNFTSKIKEKIKSMPDLKKELAPLIKDHTAMEKDTKTTLTEAQKNILETLDKKTNNENPNLTEAQKKMMEIIKRKLVDGKKQADSYNQSPENRNRIKPK